MGYSLLISGLDEQETSFLYFFDRGVNDKEFLYAQLDRDQNLGSTI